MAPPKKGGRRLRSVLPEEPAQNHAVTPAAFDKLAILDHVDVVTVMNADEEMIQLKVGDIVLLLPAKDPETPSQIVRRRPVADTAQNWEDLTYAHVTVDTSGEMSFLAPSNTSQVPVDLLESDDKVDEYKYMCGGQPVQAGYDEVWHAEIAAIRCDGADQCYVKVLWYYSTHDLNGQDVPRKTGDLKRFQETMGRMERIKLDHFTINELENVIAHSDLIQFSMTQLGLIPLSHSDVWSRGGTLKCGAARTDLEGVVKICLESGCALNREYNPGLHVIRFCSNVKCGHWYHTDCLSEKCQVEGLQALGKQIQPRALYHGLLLQEHHSQRYPLLARLLMSPIQRAPPHMWIPGSARHHLYPLSWETVISAARGLEWPTIPEKEQKWFMRNLGVPAGVSRQERQRRMEQFSQLSIPAWYRCPGCGWIV
ncbi:hypothetical protein C8Q80DRAFT_1125418 [Daedaleopsis nitida]|nr:hypothetical protein C8Q80DRAFT_1125418 [Daedaleopsis nitida]